MSCRKITPAVRIALPGILFLALVIAFTGCTGDQGPEGIAGEAGTTTCMTCHGDANTDVVARQTQWSNSVHATGGNFERNTLPCAGCHTSEGFRDKLATGTATSPENPSPIGCFTCHSPHSNADFPLRSQAAVTLEVGGGTFDRGKGNLCANCHQARTPSPPISAAPDSTTITSSHWGGHHGPQASMLSGSGGYEFTGSTYGSSYHTTGVTNGCPQCHMAAPFGSQAGGHQFGMTYLYHGAIDDLVTGCNVTGCHSGAPLTDFNRLASGDFDGDTTTEGVQDEIDGLLDQPSSSEALLTPATALWHRKDRR